MIYPTTTAQLRASRLQDIAESGAVLDDDELESLETEQEEYEERRAQLERDGE